MGDSGIAVQLSILTLLLIVTAVVTFVTACRMRNRGVRILVGVFLIAIAATCGLFSAVAGLLVAALGVTALVLSTRMRSGKTR